MRDNIHVAQAYLGVPYAETPKRWTRTRGIEKRRENVFVANQTGHDCFGRVVPGTSTSNMSEDCLTLDIYTPRIQSSNAAVMVYLHGGSLVEGSSSSIQSGYFGVANMTRANVISISVNYRVGVLGFLSIQALENLTMENLTRSEESTRHFEANFGLYDVIESLKWIQQNIAFFGGNPKHVTVYGQSSGGSLVLALSMSPLAGNLFRNGISMSGSPKLTATPEIAAKTYYSEFVANTPCKQEANLTACLYEMKPEDVQNAMPHDWDSASFSFAAFQENFTYAPVLLVDGVTVVTDYLSAIRSPPHNSPLADENFRLILGTTREEIDFAPGDDVSDFSLEKFQDFVYEHLEAGFGHDVASVVVSRYTMTNASSTSSSPIIHNSFQQTYAQIVSDATIWCPSLYMLDKGSNKTKSQFYVYQTSQKPGHAFCPLSPFQALKNYCPTFSFHAIDMFMMFQVPWGIHGCCEGDDVEYEYTHDDLKYGDLLAKRFAEFSVTNRVGAWDTYDNDRSVVRLEVPGERMENNLRVEYCDGLWWNFYDRLGLIN